MNARKDPLSVNAPLTREEQEELNTLKKHITWWAQSMPKAHDALVRIRDKRLYRTEAANFNEFCEKNWGWTRRWVDSIIQSSLAVKQLPENLRTKVLNLATARAIVKVPEEHRIEVAATVASEGPMTAKAVEKKHKQITQPDVRRDHIGRPIPKDIITEWDRADKVADELRALAQKIKLTLERNFKTDVIFSEMGALCVSDAEGWYYALGNIKPYTVCPKCNAQIQQGCRMCSGRGWVSKHYWSQCVDRKTKDTITTTYHHETQTIPD